MQEFKEGWILPALTQTCETAESSTATSVSKSFQDTVPGMSLKQICLWSLLSSLSKVYPIPRPSGNFTWHWIRLYLQMLQIIGVTWTDSCRKGCYFSYSMVRNNEFAHGPESMISHLEEFKEWIVWQNKCTCKIKRQNTFCPLIPSKILR